MLAAALALVVHGFVTGRGIAVRFARSMRTNSRRGVILAWAAGTMLGWAAPAVIGLILLGRFQALVVMPLELRQAAWALRLPAGITPAALIQLAGYAGIGVALGLTVIAIRSWLGRPPSRFVYRSPLAARSAAEFVPAALLALAAGVAEEAFFRLLLPLLVAIVTGSGVAGLAVGLIAFVALHRHQGGWGLAAVTVAGLALTYLYLLTGLLWLAMAAHAFIDFNAFVVRPWLGRFRR